MNYLEYVKKALLDYDGPDAVPVESAEIVDNELLVIIDGEMVGITANEL